MTRRWTRIAAALVLAIVAASPGHAADRPAEPRIERTPEFTRRVDDAIDRGVVWLRKVQAADGSFTGWGGYPGAVTALAYHTMRVCGVPRDDPAAVRAYDVLKASYRKNWLRTYTATLLLMAIAEHGDRDAAAKDEHDVKLGDADRKWAEEITEFLTDSQTRDGCWSYGARDGSNFDHSNTQYALLGLKSAARCGIAVDASVWKRSLVRLLAVQEKKGPEVRRRGAPGAAGDEKGRTDSASADRARGWEYGRDGGSRIAYTAMTAGGVSAVVICRSELEGTPAMTARLAADSERSVWDGLAWIGTRWTADPQAQIPDFAPDAKIPPDVKKRLDAIRLARVPSGYEYYGVERAGVLAGVEWMADLDWYAGGTNEVLRTLAADGGSVWDSADDPRGKAPPKASDPVRANRVVETCFALLFLKRGTRAVARGAVTHSGDDADVRFEVAAALQGRDFEDFVDLVLARWRRSKDDAAKARLFDGATSVGPRIVAPLLVRLGAPDAEVRAAADALLRRATGLDFKFDAAAPREQRDEAIARWQAWWTSVSETLRYDPATKRLV